jgi:hypothetical protein
MGFAAFVVDLGGVLGRAAALVFSAFMYGLL